MFPRFDLIYILGCHRDWRNAKSPDPLLDPNMPLGMFSVLAAVATAVTIYSYFSGNSKDEDGPSATQQSHTRPSPNQFTYTSSHYSHSHTANSSRSTPSASTRAYPSYQQPWNEPRTAQAAANAKSSPNVHRFGPASPSQTVPTSAPQAQIPHPTRPTTSRVLNTTSTTSTPTSYAQQTSARGTQTTARTPTKIPSSSVWDTPPPTHASYSAQHTSTPVSQTTSRTPARVDYDDYFASPSAWESRQTPATPTCACASHPLYSAYDDMADYDDDDDDDMEPSPYSYLRTPSPDASRARVSRLTVSPQKHSRTQSSSSDSDYLGPSSPTRGVSRSQSYEVHDANAGAEDKKRAMELRAQARRSAREMRDARDRAKNARRMGDLQGEGEYKQEARAHESTKKDLDKRAAKIFFRMNNKVTQQPFASYVETGGPHLIFRRVTTVGS